MCAIKDLSVAISTDDFCDRSFSVENYMRRIFDFRKDESGATAIEYGLIAALVSVAIIAGLNKVTTNLNGTFTKVSDALTTTKATPPTTSTQE
jgi:pilus assembly protein Flp/PilA